MEKQVVPSKFNRKKLFIGSIAVWLSLLTFTTPMHSLVVHAEDSKTTESTTSSSSSESSQSSSSQEDDSGTNYSLYNRAKDLSDAFSKGVAPDDTDKVKTSSLLEDGGGSAIHTGQAGGLVGFTEGKEGMIYSILSNNEVSLTVEQLKRIKIEDGKSSTLDDYAEFGLGLSNAGVDRVVGLGSFMTSFLSILVYAAYWIANATPVLMGLIVKVLKILNPFMLIKEAAHLSDSDFANTSGMADAIAPLAKVISGYLNLFQDFSLAAVVPILIIVAIISVLMFKSSFKSTFIRLFLRLAVIFIGIPVVGATYTHALNAIDDNTKGNSAYFERIVYSNYLDFRAWAFNTRLGIPSELSGTFTKEGVASKNIDTITLTLNAYALNDPSLLSLSADDMYDINDLTNTKTSESEEDSVTSPKANVDALFRSLIDKDGNKLSSSDYEGLVKADAQNIITSSGSSENQRKAVRSMFSLSSDDLKDNDKSQGILGDSRSSKASEALGNAYQWDIYNAGRLGRYSGVFQNIDAVSASAKRGETVIPSITNSSAAIAGSGLSPIAMYNYLNTTFTSSTRNTSSGTTTMGGTIKISSPEKSSNGIIRSGHMSILMTGQPFDRFLKTFVVIATFLTLAFLQLAVVWGIFKVAISELARMLGGIVGSGLGSITVFIKLVSSVFVTLGTVVATMFLYTVYASFMVSMFSILDKLVEAQTIYVVNALVKILVIVLFFMFGSRSLMAVSKQLSNIVHEIVEKIARGFEQNWAKDSSLASLGDASGMGGGFNFGQGGHGGGGGRGSNVPSAAELFGVDKVTDAVGDVVGDAGMALDNENAERAANGEPLLATKGVAGAINRIGAYKRARERSDENIADKVLQERQEQMQAEATAKYKEDVHNGTIDPSKVAPPVVQATEADLTAEDRKRIARDSRKNARRGGLRTMLKSEKDNQANNFRKKLNGTLPNGTTQGAVPQGQPGQVGGPSGAPNMQQFAGVNFSALNMGDQERLINDAFGNASNGPALFEYGAEHVDDATRTKAVEAMGAMASTYETLQRYQAAGVTEGDRFDEAQRAHAKAVEDGNKHLKNAHVNEQYINNPAMWQEGAQRLKMHNDQYRRANNYAKATGAQTATPKKSKQSQGSNSNKGSGNSNRNYNKQNYSNGNQSYNNNANNSPKKRSFKSNKK